MIRLLSLLSSGVLDLLYPQRCAVCRRLGAPYLCDRCIAAFQPVNPPLCHACGAPVSLTSPRSLARPEHGMLCMTCRQQSVFHFTWARAAGVYDGLLREAIHRLKYDLRPGLGQRLGAWARRSGGAMLRPPCSPDIVTPVPLHWTRARRRGFNQSLLIAEGIVGPRNWPIEPCILKRTRRTKPQVDLDAAQRATNVANAFAVPDAPMVKGKRVLVVDDVLTTLHTVNECARVLMQAGAAEVYVIAVAR